MFSDSVDVVLKQTLLLYNRYRMKCSWKLNLLILVVTVHCEALSTNLEPTKIVHNGVYRLEIQSEDKWLTGVRNGLPIRATWKGTEEQKWVFQKSGDNWQISTVNGIGSLPAQWKINYVGHGKFRFTNPSTGLCLRGPGCCSVREDACQKDDPGQRWLIKPA